MALRRKRENPASEGIQRAGKTNAIPFIYSPTKGSKATADELVAMVGMAFDHCEAARRSTWEPVWLRHYAAMSGCPEAVVEDFMRIRKVKVDLPDDMAWRDFCTVALSHIISAASAIASGVTQHDAKPSEETELAKMQAAIGTAWLDHYWYRHHENMLQIMEGLDLVLTGAFLRYTAWDKNAGMDPITGTQETYSDGDLVSHTLDVWHYWLPTDHRCTQWPPQWLITADVLPVEQIRGIYDNKKVEPQDVAQAMANADTLLSNVAATPNPHTAIERDGAGLVTQLWWRPSLQYPKGRRLVVSGNQLLLDTALAQGVFPFVQGQWLPRPGGQYPMSLMESAVNPQNNFNKVMRQMIRINDRKLAGDIVTAGGTKIDVKELDNGAKWYQLGEDVREFEVMQYPVDWQLARYMMELQSSMLQEVTHQSNPTLGRPDSDVDTYSQTMLLKEQDSKAMGLHMELINATQEAIAAQKLIIGGEMVHVPRRLPGLETVSPMASSWFHSGLLGNTRQVIPRSIPRLSQSEENQIIAEHEAAGLHGPYQMGAGEEYARKQAFIKSGVRNARQIVDTWGTPMAQLEQIITRMCQTQAMMQLMESDAQYEMMQTELILRRMKAPQDMSTPEMETAIMQQAGAGALPGQ